MAFGKQFVSRADNFCGFFAKVLTAKKAQKTQLHDRQISLWLGALDSKKSKKSSVIIATNFFWT